jgi:hypothetical protein
MMEVFVWTGINLKGSFYVTITLLTNIISTIFWLYQVYTNEKSNLIGNVINPDVQLVSHKCDVFTMHLKQ